VDKAAVAGGGNDRTIGPYENDTAKESPKPAA